MPESITAITTTQEMYIESFEKKKLSLLYTLTAFPPPPLYEICQYIRKYR